VSEPAQKFNVKTRFIDQFEIILLDMGRTFMFDVDRFFDADAFAETYRRMGGRMLADGDVRRIISSLFNRMLADSRDPMCYGCFPSVLAYLEKLADGTKVEKHESALLEQVFGLHEIGTIPDSHAQDLHRLRETHRLGVVSDIWSRNTLYLQELARAGVRDLFEVVVFSSDHGHLKASPYPFAKAIEAFGAPRSTMVFVGDSLRCDIAGAKAAGLSTIWLDAGDGQADTSFPSPDLVIRDLRDLLED
jgi:FMN phosphatase YigB (HAD superfamily)